MRLQRYITNEAIIPNWIIRLFDKVKKEIKYMPFTKFKEECKEAFFKIATDPKLTINESDWERFWKDMKKLGIDINNSTVKSYIETLPDRREEDLFNMEQELGIPSNLRYYNRKKNESIDTLDEDAKHWWELVKQEAFPTLAFYPALQIWLELDKMLKGTEYSGKIISFYAAFWLLLVSGKYVKGWLDWKKDNPEQHAKEVEMGGGGLI
jgi:hypothetical protein